MSRWMKTLCDVARSVEPTQDRRGANADSPRQVACRHSLAVHDEAPRAAPIVGLDSWRSPSAVRWLVRTIHIDSIESGAGWSGSHVRAKRLEAVLPARTDRDAATAVVGVVRVTRSQTAALHSAPRPVLEREAAKSRRAAVGFDRVARLIIAIAATALAEALRQIVGIHDAMAAAVTAHRPVMLLDRVRRDDCEPAESLSSEIFRSWPRHERFYRINRPMSHLFYNDVP